MPRSVRGRGLAIPIILVLSTVLLSPPGVAPAAAYHEGDDAHHPWANSYFEDTWARTDKPVADRAVERTWMWGPEPYTEQLWESYEESPGHRRVVQYTDKSRMEINQPNDPPDDLWYVTNGLLALELITGQMQVGDDAFEAREPADVNVAGDPGSGPSYADLTSHLDDAPLANGSTIVQRIDSEGRVTSDQSLAGQGVTAVHVAESGINHTIASAFWDFMNSEGIVWDDAYVTDKLFVNPFYGIGFPITEPYWTTVSVAGIPQTVLLQCFERRCLTYTPGNAPGWRTESGNVGQHYHIWRYGEPNPPPPDTETVSIYLILLGDDGDNGIPVGCDDSLVDVDVEIPIADNLEERIQFTLEYLFDLDEYEYGESGFVNPLYQSNLAVDEVEVDDGVATVDLLGQLVSAGACDDPRLIGQIVQSVLQFDGVNEVVVNLNGTRIYPVVPPVSADYEVQFRSLNGSDVGVTANLTLEDHELTVSIEGQGLEDGTHPMHIHGFANGTNAVCPPPGAAGADGILTNSEGMVIYGQVLIELTPFPVVGEDGELSYEETITLTDSQLASLGNLTLNTIVVHGLTIDPDGDGSLPTAYDSSLPIACGTVEEATEPAPLSYTVQVGGLNGSGAHGSGTLTIDGNVMTVALQLSGLEPGTHSIRIQGHPNEFSSAGDPSVCPTPDDDDNLNEVIELDEAEAVAGEDLQLLASPLVPGNGQTSLQATFIVDAALVGPLENRAIVALGLSVDLDGDDVDDPQYDGSVPAACGLIAAAEPEVNGESQTFAATLGGSSAVPPVATVARGTFVARLDPTGEVLTWQLILSDIEGVVEANLHQGGPGTLGQVIWELFDAQGAPVDLEDDQLWSGMLTEDDLAGADVTFNELIDLLTAGGVYINVETVTYPTGEVRGQVGLVGD